jgi:signal transduction histidine kinase
MTASGGRHVASIQFAIASAIALGGIAAGAAIGGLLAVAQRRIIDDLDHDLRMPMTIIRGEVELVLSRDDVSASERERSSQAVIAETERLEQILRQAE